MFALLTMATQFLLRYTTFFLHRRYRLQLFTVLPVLRAYMVLHCSVRAVATGERPHPNPSSSLLARASVGWSFSSLSAKVSSVLAKAGEAWTFLGGSCGSERSEARNKEKFETWGLGRYCSLLESD